MTKLTTKNQDKERLIEELMGTVNEMQRKFQSEDDEEKQWLIENSPSSDVAMIVKDMTVMMLHVLDAIGKLEPVNGITISKQFGISKGSVSKITRKMVDKQLIRIEYLPDNKKEILFRTTPMGKQIYHLHEALHHQIGIGVNRFLSRYNEDELHFLVKTLRETLHTSWVHSETNEEWNVRNRGNGRPDEAHETDRGFPASSALKEREEITEMLNKLDSRNLKKAKAILNDVFFTEYEE